jgi:hypothetical protein
LYAIKASRIHIVIKITKMKNPNTAPIATCIVVV